MPLPCKRGLDEQRPELVAAEADRAHDPWSLEADEDIALDQPLRDLVRRMVGRDQLDDRGPVIAGVGQPHGPPDEVAEGRHVGGGGGAYRQRVHALCYASWGKNSSDTSHPVRRLRGHCPCGLGIDAPLAADPAAVARGKYLVTIASCHDCHTPGYFLGKPDMARYLGGSDVGFELPGLGVFHGPNLTPDKETGLGDWTDAQVLTALQTGVRPDGRVLAPIMPWRAFAIAHQAGRRGHRRLPAQRAAGEPQGARPVRPHRDADLVRHRGAVEAGNGRRVEFRDVGDTTDSTLLFVDEHHHASLAVGADAEVEFTECAGRDFHVGRVTVRFGGAKGHSLTLAAGDVVVLPAGTGHRRIRASRDLLVVGAYPPDGRYDEPRPEEVDPAEARASIAKVKVPRQDPLYGPDGALTELWSRPARTRQRQVARARRASARAKQGTKTAPV